MRIWVDIFGNVQIVPLNLSCSNNQFQIYNHISKNYEYSFLFESLTGPKDLAETSVMGFDPIMVLKAYLDCVEITICDKNDKHRDDNMSPIVIKTDDPFRSLRSILRNSATCTNIHDLRQLFFDDFDTNNSDLNYDDCDTKCVDNNCNDDDSKCSTDFLYDYRYVGGAVGMINYDAIRMIENIPDSNGANPLLMEFGIYNDGILYDNKLQKPFYFYRGVNRLEKLMLDCNDISVSVDDKHDDDKNPDRFYASDATPNINQEQFSTMISKAKKYVHSGDVFQVVLSRRFNFDTRGDTLALYGALRDLNPSPYMYHLKHGKHITIGASPEMLIRITNDVVETFPIAGTRKMTGDKSFDDTLAKELLADQKELAEHTMLVDLGRNDIGRVCKFGTVQPKSLMEIKQFSHVQHIVTHLIGDLDDDNDMFDAFKAVFPAGTVSGAPKVRAMEIIDELESDARGPYAGAVGYFSYNNCCDFAIAIRSMFINGNKGFVQSGAGIVYDSVSEREFKETEHKASAMIQALRGASK